MHAQALCFQVALWTPEYVIILGSTEKVFPEFIPGCLCAPETQICREYTIFPFISQIRFQLAPASSWFPNRFMDSRVCNYIGTNKKSLSRVHPGSFHSAKRPKFGENRSFFMNFIIFVNIFKALFPLNLSQKVKCGA